MAFGLSAALVFGARFLGPSKLQQAEAFAEKSERKLDPLWPAPPFAYRDQHGQTVTQDTLRGKVWVANFIFTQCRTICPLLSAKMVQLQRQLAGVDVRFVSFSVDPAHDTPEVLAAYAQRWHAEETRWLLLATDEQTLPATAAGFHVTAKKNEAPGAAGPHHPQRRLRAGGRRGHGARRLRFGAPRGLRGPAARRARGWLGDPPRPAPRAPRRRGAVPRAVLRGCHERPELAPPLTGLAAAPRARQRQLVVADAAYVRSPGAA